MVSASTILVLNEREPCDSAAAQQGNLVVLDLLLRAGAAVDWVSDDASTPLYVASWKGHEQVRAFSTAVTPVVSSTTATLCLRNQRQASHWGVREHQHIHASHGHFDRRWCSDSWRPGRRRTAITGSGACVRSLRANTDADTTVIPY